MDYNGQRTEGDRLHDETVKWREDAAAWGRGAEEGRGLGEETLRWRDSVDELRDIDWNNQEDAIGNPPSPLRFGGGQGMPQSSPRKSPRPGRSGRSRSPARQQHSSHDLTASRHQSTSSLHDLPDKQPAPRPRSSPHKKAKSYRYRDLVQDEPSVSRVEGLSIVLHVVVIGTALMVIIPMAMVTTKWQKQRQRCPLFVDQPPTLADYHLGWGNEDMTSCKMTAFVPVVVLLLSVTLVLFHAILLYSYRATSQTPSLAFSRVYSIVTLVIVVLEVLVAFAVAITLTEGFKQTCLSFDLNLSWNESPNTCNFNLDDRDESYRMADFNTFGKIVTALVGAWTCTVATILLVIVNLTRARLCACYLLY